MEKKKLDDILANANATSEQVMEQQRLATEAEERAMRETQRLVHNYDTYMMKSS